MFTCATVSPGLGALNFLKATCSECIVWFVHSRLAAEFLEAELMRRASGMLLQAPGVLHAVLPPRSLQGLPKAPGSWTPPRG